MLMTYRKVLLVCLAIDWFFGKNIWCIYFSLKNSYFIFCFFVRFYDLMIFYFLLLVLWEEILVLFLERRIFIYYVIKQYFCFLWWLNSWADLLSSPNSECSQNEDKEILIKSHMLRVERAHFEITGCHYNPKYFCMAFVFPFLFDLLF